jgi:LysM repeat protein
MFRAALVRQCILVVGLALLMSGCFPSPESPVDEERDPHFLTGRARAESQDYQGAVDEFEKALEVNPKNAAAHFELGVILENQLRDYAAAIYHYEKFQRLRTDGAAAAKAAERIKVCKGNLGGIEFIPPTSVMLQNEVTKLNLSNLALLQEVFALRAQLHGRTPQPGRDEVLRAPPRQPDPAASRPAVQVTPGTAHSPPLNMLPPTAVYVVASGDTVGSICRKLKIKQKKLEAANPGLDPRRLRVGQKLNLPPP